MENDNPSVVTDAMIARRALEIAESDDAGTDDENWERAARELRGELGEEDRPSP